MCRNQVFFIFANGSRSKQNKKNPEHPFVNISQWELCGKFLQKILNSAVVGARQRFQFFIKKPGFSKTIKLCLNFYKGFRITYLVLSSPNKISP